MRLVTYSVGTAGPVRAGVRVGHRILDIEAASRVKGEPLPSSVKALLDAGRGALARVQALAKAATTEARSFTQALCEERAIRFLPPIPDAGRFVCVRHGTEAGAHGERTDSTGSEAPVSFTMDGSRLVGHNMKLACPEGAKEARCELALAFVIGRHAKDVTDIDVADYVAGITLLVELTGRNSRKAETASGSRDAKDDPLAGPGALGSDIVTMDEVADLDDLLMICTVNGEERLRASTRDQNMKLEELIEHFSRVAAWEPGDMISVSARGGESDAAASGLIVKPGDVVEFAIEGIAAIRTTIIAAGES